MRALLLVLAVLLPLAVMAEAPPDAPAPDPVTLKADWWSYFAADGELDAAALEARIARLDALLRAYLETAGVGRSGEAAARIKQLSDALARYRQLRSQAVARPEGVPVAGAEHYSIDEALARHRQWQALQRRSEAAREQLDWQEVVFEQARKQQSRQRSRYLELPQDSEQRLQRGLALMLGRVRLEIDRLELERRRDALGLDEDQLQRLDDELRLIPERLQIAEDQPALWQRRAQRARRAVEDLRAKAERLRDNGGATAAVAAGDQAQWRLVEAIGIEAALGVQELRVMQARLARALIVQTGAATGAGAEPAQTVMDENQTLSESLREQHERWQRVSVRVRAALGGEAGEEGAATAARVREHLDALDGTLLQLEQQRAENQFLGRLLEARLHLDEGWLSRTWHAGWAGVKGFWDQGVNLLGSTLFEISETPVTTFGLLRVLLILTIAWWVSKAFQRAIRRVGATRGAISQSSLYTVGRLVHYTVLAVGIIIGLSSIGIDFTKFALFASALGVGIGFGLQTLISNFVAGLIILFEKSLKVGDFVELESGVSGEVREINMRSTLITTNDNVDILVPNSEFVGGRVTNWTMRESYRRIHVAFGVAYGTDKERVKKAVLEAADAVRWTLKGVGGRQPQVWFVEFGDSSLNFELVVWLTPEAVKRPGAVNADYLWEIESKLKEYAIEVPFPQRDLHLRSLFGSKGEQARSLISATPPAADSAS